MYDKLSKIPGEISTKNGKVEEYKANKATMKKAPSTDLFEQKSWKGVIDVFSCKNCSFFTEDRDDMITHVLRHVPEEDRDYVLSKLIKK